MSKKSNRILKQENKAYNDEWESQYFVVSRSGKMQCFLCETVISLVKK